MTGFLLDTNVVSEMIKPAPDPRVTGFLRERHDRLWLSVVVLYELELRSPTAPRGPAAKSRCIRRALHPG